MSTDKPSTITSQSDDFSVWYQDVIAAAELAEHSGVKGSMVIKPHGYAIWEKIQAILDQKIKETGHKNAYFPLLIPEEYLRREKEHVKGFSPELAVVTHAGGEELAEPLVVRPTSETIIYATFSRWIQSWRDLPLLINQWANVVRWELRPRLFLRTTEFLWQEGHTAHATEEEAEEEARRMLQVYKDFLEQILAIPVVDGEKTAGERFAGALRTYTVEALMQDGKALQAGTSHNLGQNFAKVFDVTYTDEQGKRQHVWQTSWGVSTRLIGGLIMTHSDNKGLVLPPAIAPMGVVIVPIWRSGDERIKVLSEAEKIQKELSEITTVIVDDRDHYSPGYKFHEWERKGVPVRIELGPRDLVNQQVLVARRDTGEKKEFTRRGLKSQVKFLLKNIQDDLLARARGRLDEQTFWIDDYTAFAKQVKAGGLIWSPWCGNEACEAKVHEDTKATIRCIPFAQPRKKLAPCLVCGKKARTLGVFAKAY